MHCSVCNKEVISNHHYETEINQALQRCKDADHHAPWFKSGTFDAFVIGCHVNQDNSIHIHYERHWDGQIIDKEYCTSIDEKRAKYILAKIKRHIDAMLYLDQVKKETEDVCEMLLNTVLLEKFGQNYVNVKSNGWDHLKSEALKHLDHYIHDFYLNKKQIEQIRLYAETLRKNK